MSTNLPPDDIKEWIGSRYALAAPAADEAYDYEYLHALLARIEIAYPNISIERRPHICDDELDTKNLGAVDWVDYRARVPDDDDDTADDDDDDTAVEVNLSPDWVPLIFLPGQPGIDFATFRDWLPAIVAICMDRQVLAAVAAHPGTRVPNSD